MWNAADLLHFITQPPSQEQLSTPCRGVMNSLIAEHLKVCAEIYLKIESLVKGLESFREKLIMLKKKNYKSKLQITIITNLLSN